MKWGGAGYEADKQIIKADKIQNTEKLELDMICHVICVPDVQSTYRNTLVIPHTYLSYYFSFARFQCVTCRATALSAHT